MKTNLERDKMVTTQLFVVEVLFPFIDSSTCCVEIYPVHPPPSSSAFIPPPHSPSHHHNPSDLRTIYARQDPNADFTTGALIPFFKSAEQDEKQCDHPRYRCRGNQGGRAYGTEIDNHLS